VAQPKERKIRQRLDIPMRRRKPDEKTKTMQEYKSCIKKAKEDQAKLDACERLIKANE
jgi:hypothetical protein